jgi:hypothetical protein
MAGMVSPSVGSGFQGVPSIYEFTNDDGSDPRRACAHAAVATMLRFRGLEAVRVGDLEARFPADVLRGAWGTSRRQVERMIRAGGRPLAVVEGVDALRRSLTARQPAVVMLDISEYPGRWPWTWRLGGHWVVAYGFDEENVYLSNWGDMTWARFAACWGSWMPRAIGMCRRGLVVL